MKKVSLTITNSYERKTVSVADELSLGRTSAAQVVIDDDGLSRVNTTFFRDGDYVLVADENSLNGTFLNGVQIVGHPRVLRDGDEIRIGSETLIQVLINDDLDGLYNFPADGYVGKTAGINANEKERYSPPLPPESRNKKSEIRTLKLSNSPFILITAAFLALSIIFFSTIAFFTASKNDEGPTNISHTSQINSSALIPVRVVNVLGVDDPDDLDDLMASWEVEEEELEAADIDVIKTSGAGPSATSDLKVSIEFWKAQRDKALNHSGLSEPLQTPPELMGRGVPKQTAKLAELIKQGGYKQPLDFADLAELQLKGTLVELPMATETYILDVGGSAGEEEFTSFDWDENGNKKIELITPNHTKYKFLKHLADKLNYSLDNPRDRKQMRIRLLRMYNPKSRKFLEEICAAYYQKFKVPLRITSLTRSMDYQISLNKTNSNSFRVSGKGSLPPHTSGCAFDMSRKNLSYGEQNFIMTKLAEMERAQKIDSLIEGNANACFHTFIFP